MQTAAGLDSLTCAPTQHSTTRGLRSPLKFAQWRLSCRFSGCDSEPSVKDCSLQHSTNWQPPSGGVLTVPRWQAEVAVQGRAAPPHRRTAARGLPDQAARWLKARCDGGRTGQTRSASFTWKRTKYQSNKMYRKYSVHARARHKLDAVILPSTHQPLDWPPGASGNLLHPRHRSSSKSTLKNMFIRFHFPGVFFGQ